MRTAFKTLFVVTVLLGTARADVLPADCVVRVTLERPMAAAGQPMLRDMAQALLATPAFQASLSAVDQLKLQQSKDLIEKSLGKPWAEGLDQLVTRAWMGISLPNGPGQPLVACLVFESSEAALLEKFVQGSVDYLAAQQPKIVPQPRRTGDREWFQVGDAGYSRIGKYLIVGGNLKAIEKFLGQFSPPAESPPPSTARLHVEVDLARIRTLPPVQQALQWPTKNAGLAVLAGGYQDLLRRASRLQGELKVDDSGVTLTIDADAGTNGLPAGLAGFFAGVSGTAAPLLSVPRSLYSASWVRDYAPLWTHRKEIVGSGFDQAEQEYEKQRSRYGFGPDELTRWVGTRWRVVVARQPETIYRRQPAERLPALAVVVDVRDEASFGRTVFPALDKAARGPITLVFGYPKNTEYKQAKITSVRIKEPEGEPEPGDYRYSVSPAMTATRGHFIVGSTEGIVHQVIDELDGQALLKQAASEPGTTDLQQLSFPELAALTAEFRDTILRKIVLEGGLTVSEGEQNTAAAGTILSRLGQVTSTTKVTPDRFQTTLRLGGR